MLRKFIRGAAVLLSTAVLLFTFSPLSAQNTSGSGLQISPTRQELTVERGEQQQFKISLKNISGVDITAKVSVNDFTSDNDTGDPKIFPDTDPESPNSIRQYLHGLNDIDMTKDQSVEVPVDVIVPADSTPGAYYGLVRFQAVPKNADESGNVSLTASVGTIVLLQVPGQLSESMRIDAVKAESANNMARSFYFGKGPKQIAVQLTNTGNSFLKPFGTVTITRGGKEVYSYELNNVVPRSNILPNSTRNFRDPAQNVNSLGKYRVTANLGYTDGGEVLTASATFWVIPMWAVLVAIAIVVLLIAGFMAIVFKLRGTKKRHKKHSNAEF